MDYPMEKIEGKDGTRDIKLWTLSTCGWCRKTKSLLNELEVSYLYVDVDLLGFDDKIKAKAELKKFNPRVSYPTVVIDGEAVIGFDKDKIIEKIQ